MQLRSIGWLAAAGVVLVASESAQAQAWNYPAMQAPRIEQREYNFGLAAGGDAGTSLFVQWREGMGANTQFNLEAGIADPDGGDARFLLGGGLAFGVARASQTQPLDIVLTGGIYPSFGDPVTFVRVPFGAVLGHRFVPQGSQIALTPYVHPRVSLDVCAGGDLCDAIDNAGGDQTEINLNFDLGLDLEVNRNLSVRGAIVIPGGDFFDDAGFGLSLAWRPAGITRR